MKTAVFAVGGAAGLLLLSVLVLTLLDPRSRFWPTPGPGTWESIAFWTSFRTLNASVLVVALLSVTNLSEIGPAGVAALLVGLASFGLYGYACFSLGRENLYCGKAGLVTSGIYRWSRNPQYATIIPAYLGITIASGSLQGMLLAVLASLAFLLMAVSEERWLTQAYGDAYARYQAVVPRFYNVRRIGIVLALILARAVRAQDRGATPALRGRRGLRQKHSGNVSA